MFVASLGIAQCTVWAAVLVSPVCLKLSMTTLYSADFFLIYQVVKCNIHTERSVKHTLLKLMESSKAHSHVSVTYIKTCNVASAGRPQMSLPDRGSYLDFYHD